MAHAIGLRATSLVASATLLGFAVVAGLTMTIVQQQIEALIEDRPIETVVEQPPPDPTPIVRHTEPPLRALEGETFDPIPPPQPLEDASTQISTNHNWTAAPPTIVNPQWVRRPRDLARYYPARAVERGVEGRVVLDCAVSVRGTLNCLVVSETPAQWGFAAAALRISRDYQMVPAMRDGSPIEARHRMVIPFELQ